MQYADEFGDSEARFLIKFIQKVVESSCDELVARPMVGKMPYISEADKTEIRALYADIITCHDCGRKVNYCCRYHQTAMEARK